MTEAELKWPQMTEEQLSLCERLIEKFKGQLKSAAEDALSTVYVDVMPHIESDTFLNFKSQAMSVIRGYATKDALTAGDYSGQHIRAKIFEEHKNELVELINQDHLATIKGLREDLKCEREYNRRY
jgi:hypothetical protein